MRASSAISPIFDLYTAIKWAIAPTLRGIISTPYILLHPIQLSQLFFVSFWSKFGFFVDENSRAIKEKLITPNAFGTVLDIGAGTGHTIKYLDRTKVITYIALEPNVRMHSDIRLAAATAGYTEADHSLIILPIGAEDISSIISALGDYGVTMSSNGSGGIDTIVSILTFCTVPNAESALPSLIQRVLRSPGGTFLFYEHVLSERDDVRWWQRAWTPIWRIIFDGCELHRPTHTWIENVGGWSKAHVWKNERESEESLFPHRTGIYIRA